MIQYDHKVKVYYKDVDQMGIVYYSRYFEFFEEARTEMLSSIGLDYSDVEAQGVKLPVIEAYANYRKGAYFEQEIIIEIFIPEIPKAKLKIKYNVHPKESDEILATGFTVHAFMNTSGRPIKAPAFIVEKIKEQMKV